ncbi:MAG: asparagine synthase (glutamine-hydrolyzing) [Cytophagales bacterium]|nr:MAG: asparagine synthase (glutamine-hydrolyzing) [Cytophagales bacterium]
MCGITGFVHFDTQKEASLASLKKMTDSIAHRGPDGEGFFCQNNIALGHRRLSIIDLNTGAQPMQSDEGTIQVVFNGEIYNYIELKEELRQLGHSFKTTSDTEVIIKAYQQWGIDFQNKLNGMWALALWDNQQKQLILSIDRMGEKPLYYTLYENTLLFGSEIKTLEAFGVPLALHWELAELYFSLLYIPAPFSFYKNIHKLQPAHCIIIRPFENNTIVQRPYWQLPACRDKDMRTDKAQVHRDFEALFYDAIRIRMRSDVPFGAFLSGGLDSSSIVALMSEIVNYPIQTFTIGFAEKEFDETALAAEVAQKFNTNHQVQIVTPTSFDEALQKIAHHYDEPFGDSSAIPTGYVSAFARKHVKMVLTGDGGDEVLSGYTTYQGEKFASQFQKLPRIFQKAIPKVANQIAKINKGNRIGYGMRRVQNLTEVSQQPFIDRLADKAGFYGKKIAKELTQHLPTIRIEDYLHDFYKDCPYEDNFYKMMYFNLKNSLPYDMLVKVDRMSMAHSLETRVPFLDYRLVELMVQVHKKVKMEGYERKSVLRKTVARKLPPNLLKAGKKGFGVPLREWFKDKSFEQRLDSLKQDFGLHNPSIERIIRENNTGERDHGNLIWMLFILKKAIGKA